MPLRLVARGGGNDHAAGAEPALERLSIEKSLVHRVGAAVAAEAFDGGDGAAVGAKRRNDAAVHRLALDQHHARATIAGVAALLDTEMAELAQDRAQSFPAPARFRTSQPPHPRAH